MGDEHEAGPDLDILILEVVFGFPRKKCYRPYEESLDYSYIPSGKSRRTHSIDARPVPRFSREMGAAWLVWKEVRALPCAKLAYFWTTLRGLVSLRIGQDYRITDATAALHMEPEDICKAMLEVHGVRMMPDWYYD